MLGLTLLNQEGLKIKEDVALLQARLERLFFTSPNDLIGHLGKGSKILDYFWEGDTVENAQAILHEVKWLIRNYEPNIVPISIAVRLSSLDNGAGTALIISLNFYWVGNESEDYDINIIKVK